MYYRGPLKFKEFVAKFPVETAAVPALTALGALTQPAALPVVLGYAALQTAVGSAAVRGVYHVVKGRKRSRDEFEQTSNDAPDTQEPAAKKARIEAPEEGANEAMEVDAESNPLPFVLVTNPESALVPVSTIIAVPDMPASVLSIEASEAQLNASKSSAPVLPALQASKKQWAEVPEVGNVAKRTRAQRQKW